MSSCFSLSFSFLDSDAFIPNSAEPGQLLVHLDGVPNLGKYWIFALGPVVDGLYDWAIVSNPTETTLFGLVRDVQRFENEYAPVMKQWLASNGFVDSWNLPEPAKYLDQCVWPTE